MAGSGESGHEGQWRWQWMVVMVVATELEEKEKRKKKKKRSGREEVFFCVLDSFVGFDWKRPKCTFAILVL